MLYLEYVNNLRTLEEKFMGRIFDVIIAGLGILILLPLLGLVALAIKLHDGGAIFYRARRVGKNGEIFRLYKFRTMVMNADRQGAAITSRGDTRITPIGKWLRKTKLDELPQLVNVVLGDMRLVGPRPEDPAYVALYDRSQRRVLDFYPGITSMASIAYRNEAQILSTLDWEEKYRNEVLPAKLAIDIEYLNRRNLLTDIRVILKTISVIISK